MEVRAIRYAKRVVLASLLVISSCRGISQVRSVEGLLRRLEAHAKASSKSYDEMIRDATHEVRDSLLNCSWKEAKESIERQGAKPARAGEPLYRYITAKDAWRPRGGPAHDIFIDIVIDIDHRNPEEAKNVNPDKVVEAWAGLTCQPDLALNEVLKKDWYSRVSVLFSALRHPDMQSVAKKYPVLHRIVVCYLLSAGPTASDGPLHWEFRVRFTFARRVDGTFSTATVLMGAASGLDPSQDRSTGREIRQGYVRSNSLGPWRVDIIE